MLKRTEAVYFKYKMFQKNSILLCLEQGLLTGDLTIVIGVFGSSSEENISPSSGSLNSSSRSIELLSSSDLGDFGLLLESSCEGQGYFRAMQF